MDWEVILNLFTSPFIMFIFTIVAIVLAIAALIATLTIAGKVSKVVSAATLPQPPPPPTRESVQPPQPSLLPAPPAPPAEESKMAEKEEKGGEVIRVAAGFESLQEIALLLGVDSLLLFNLNGMAIESYGVKDEAKMAASITEFVASLRNLGFPTETVTLKNGVKTWIISVGKVGEMEIYALMIGGADLEVDEGEARQLLNTYIADMTRGKGGGEG